MSDLLATIPNGSALKALYGEHPGSFEQVVTAIDPGPVESAIVELDPRGAVRYCMKMPNALMLDCYALQNTGPLAIEMIASYGMPVGEDVFNTCRFIGRLQQASRDPESVIFVKRIEVKSHLCHNGAARDSNIRQAIIDLYGGKEAAIGRKASPGPLYGVSGDMWSALAVALVVQDRLRSKA